jgi:hypothetical protein
LIFNKRDIHGDAWLTNSGKKKKMNKSAKEDMENYKIILSFLEQSKVILEIMTVMF